MKKRYTLYLLAALSLYACKPHSSGSFETIDYVNRIVADTTCTEYGLIRSFRPGDSKGSIAVIGEPEESIYLAEKMVYSDRFNNITGRSGNDQLPDFAGERIAVQMDEVNAPYDRFLGGKEAELREAVVRNAVLALDTLSRLNSFNEEAVLPKERSKILILSSSVAYGCGYADVDTLFKMASRRIPVITPAGSMLSRAFDGARGALNIGVWAREEVVASGAYQTAFAHFSAAAPKGVTATLSVFTPGNEGDAGDRLTRFLDQYMQGGAAFPLSVLLLDDYGVSVDLLEERLAEIRRMETPEMVEYNRLLAPDFHFIDAAGAVIGDVYQFMRRNNLFTHDIAYPRIELYQTLEADGLFILTPSTEKNVKLETLEFINENTIAVKNFYAVQGKH